MMHVPFMDLRAQHNLMADELEGSLKAVIESSAFASGPYVQDFEESFSKFCGAKYCVAVNSGTSALHVALLANGIGPGDEVITVPNSFIATSWAISYCGAKPVFVDVDPNTFLMNPGLLEQAITPRTKALLPVHLYGQPTEMEPINQIAAEHGLTVVEDAAQAHAATYRDKRIGGADNATCFSFYPGKNLGALGEGGAVVTNDEATAAYMRRLRDHGQSKKYYHEFLAYNYRMDGLQGAALSVKLRRLSDWTQRRRAIARHYTDGLEHLSELQVPHVRDNTRSAFHLYVVSAPRRSELMQHLNDNGIATGLHYPVPIHLQEAYSHLGHRKGDFPVAERNASQCLSLPIYPELTEDQVAYVIDHVKAFLS